MNTLAGIVCVRNGDALDYSWREAVHSLLQVCDEVLISDCDSTDGTREAMNAWECVSTKITLCNYPWSNPERTDQWYPEWVNYARQHSKAKHCIYLDADEVLHEDDYGLIRKAADQGQTLFFKRLNFWRDAQSLIPEGVCCGTKVLRMAPSNMPVPSDYPWLPAEETMKQAQESNIRVFHYGFLRKREAFFKKARVVQRIWAGSYDARLEAAEKFEGNWMTDPNVVPWTNELVPYNGTHPKVIHKWLIERGMKP